MNPVWPILPNLKRCRPRCWRSRHQSGRLRCSGSPPHAPSISVSTSMGRGADWLSASSDSSRRSPTICLLAVFVQRVAGGKRREGPPACDVLLSSRRTTNRASSLHTRQTQRPPSDVRMRGTSKWQGTSPSRLRRLVAHELVHSVRLEASRSWQETNRPSSERRSQRSAPPAQSSQ